MRFVQLTCLLLAGSATAATVTRGPFLQLPTPQSMTVVFLTDVPAVGAVRFGPAGGALTGMVSDLAPTTEHVLRLGSLSPSTRYSYEVSLDGVLVAGGDDFRFRTSPLPGSAEPFRLFAWGDSGLGNVAQLSVADRLAAQAGDATFFLILGDIIYYLGQPELYDARYFTPYASLLRHLVGWPTIGNHDVGLDPLGGPYLDAFHLPTNNPEGSELYYSFDYGDAHFVCLDTHVNSLAAGSPQLTWAQADLSASSARWKFVYFHVPPYSGGTHADNPAIRDTVLPLLEAAGADVVFSGHSHVYERTYLLSASTIVQADRSTYSKVSADGGTLYVVTGTAGQSGGLSNPTHPLMAWQEGGVLGASVIDVTPETVRGYFLKADGTAVDLFELSKAPDVSAPRLLGLRVRSERTLEVAFDEPLSNAEEPERWLTGAPLVSARLSSDRRTVTLETAAHRPGRYTLGIDGLRDASDAGNALSASVPYVVRQQLPLTPDEVRWVTSEQPPPLEWVSPTFDDSQWSRGVLPLGFGLPVATSTPNATSLFARLHFRLPVARRLLSELTLLLDYDDGVVVTLNGAEVHRQNVPLAQDPWTTATGVREQGYTQELTLPAPARALLRDGDNVLTLEVHDATGGAGDAYLSARLLGALEPPRALDAGQLPVASLPAVDAGSPDAGSVEPPQDGGVADGGSPVVNFGGSGCSCASLDAGWAALVLLALVRRRP